MELENIDNMVTFFRLQSEKKLIPDPTPYKNTDIGKRQVAIIRQLQTIQRRCVTRWHSGRINEADQMFKDLQTLPV